MSHWPFNVWYRSWAWPLAVLFGLLVCACQKPQVESVHTMAFLAQTDGYWKAWVSGLDGSRPTQVKVGDGDVSRISWFPRGEELLVDLQDGRLLRVNVATGESRPIQAPLPGIQDAVVSPDGKMIAFSYGASESIYNNDVWVFDIASGAPAKLTSMPGLQHEPAWSADGAWLYFLSGMGGQFHDIWRLKMADHSIEQVTVNELYHFDLAPSDDGTIAYSGNKNGNYDLWLRHLDGKTEYLTRDVALDARPTWLPGEQQLAFESTRGGSLNIWEIDVKTKALTQITHNQDGARMPVIALVARP